MLSRPRTGPAKARAVVETVQHAGVVLGVESQAEAPDAHQRLQ